VVGGETFLGDETNNLLTGTAANETFIGGQGNDTIVGNGGNDAFSAGSGDDVIRLGAAGSPLLEFIKIKGGSGFDTLALEGSDVGLDFSLPIANRIDGIERIDLTGSGNNTLILGLQDLLGLSDTTNSLFVTGDSGDGVVSSAGWMPDGQTTFEGVDYNSYYLPGTTANLLIDLQLMASSSIT